MNILYTDTVCLLNLPFSLYWLPWGFLRKVSCWGRVLSKVSNPWPRCQTCSPVPMNVADIKLKWYLKVLWDLCVYTFPPNPRGVVTQLHTSSWWTLRQPHCITMWKGWTCRHQIGHSSVCWHGVSQTGLELADLLLLASPVLCCSHVPPPVMLLRHLTDTESQ